MDAGTVSPCPNLLAQLAHLAAVVTSAGWTARRLPCVQVFNTLNLWSVQPLRRIAQGRSQGGAELETPGVKERSSDAADLLLRRAVAPLDTPKRRVGVSGGLPLDSPVSEEFPAPPDLAAKTRDCWFLVRAEPDVEGAPFVELGKNELNGVKTFPLSGNPCAPNGPWCLSQ